MKTNDPKTCVKSQVKINYGSEYILHNMTNNEYILYMTFIVFYKYK